jgi:hypothetical protein
VRLKKIFSTKRNTSIMKKNFLILFSIGLIASLFIGSPLLGAVSAVGFVYTNAKSFISDFAFLTLVPGIMRDPQTGNEVPPMTRAEKALFDQLITLGRANPVTLAAINDGGISFDPISYYIRYTLTGLSGTQTFLNAQTTRIVGTTNFNNGATLPQYYNFCFDRIAVRAFATNTAETAVNATSGYSSVMASMDPAIRNGELIIRSNRNIIVETPITDFLCEALVTGGGARENAGGILEKPRFFLELLQIEAQIALAGTVSSTANTTTVLEVIFSGVQARLKA